MAAGGVVNVDDTVFQENTGERGGINAGTGAANLDSRFNWLCHFAGTA